MSEVKIKISTEDAETIATMVVAKLRATEPKAPIVYTIDEVAKIAKKHRNTIAKHIKLKLLTAAKTGNSFLITEEALNEYLNN